MKEAKSKQVLPPRYTDAVMRQKKLAKAFRSDATMSERFRAARINAAQKVIFCFDHTKFGRQSVLSLCELEVIDTIVTDSAAPVELVEQFREKGIEVIVATLD